MGHCTATPEGMGVSPETLKQWFMAEPPLGNGWSKVGYRTVFDLDGMADDLLMDYDMNGFIEWDEVTYGARGYNSESIHFAYVGGCDRWMKPKDTRTPAQKRSMEYYIKNTLSYYPDIKIVGHNQVNRNKDCPSFDMPTWLRSIGIEEKNIFQNQVTRMSIGSGLNPYDFDKYFIQQQIKATQWDNT